MSTTTWREIQAFGISKNKLDNIRRRKNNDGRRASNYFKDPKFSPNFFNNDQRLRDAVTLRMVATGCTKKDIVYYLGVRGTVFTAWLEGREPNCFKISVPELQRICDFLEIGVSLNVTMLNKSS